MPERSSPHDRVEFEAPAYTGTFVLQMVLLAFASLGLHVGLFWFAMEFLLPSQKLAPTLALKANVNIVPGSTTVCEGKVWVSVTSMTAPVYGTANDRPPISHLIALDVVTGKTLETNITLSPSPSGLVTMDDQVWCVAETVVYRIENGEAIPRYPQRRLIQPSKPFVHKGQLAVIDKDQSGSATLLTWNDGEWTDEGPVDVSIPASGRWISPELRVVSNGTKTFVVFSDSMSILYREGFAMHPVDTLSAEPEPASALHPENDLSDRLSSMLSTRPAAGRTHLPGWKELPQLNNWGTKWDLSDACINDDNESDSISFGFSSAWAPPVTAFETWARGQDNVTFQLDYFEPGIGFVGTATYDGEYFDDNYIEASDDYAAYKTKTQEEWGWEEDEDEEPLTEWYKEGVKDKGLE